MRMFAAFRFGLPALSDVPLTFRLDLHLARVVRAVRHYRHMAHAQPGMARGVAGAIAGAGNRAAVDLR